ncbi:hypothetical protein JHN47_02640 [Streptomyces sp. MBT62]|nr:hypothetical protein [Streptomyces sp. MBT62]
MSTPTVTTFPGRLVGAAALATLAFTVSGCSGSSMHHDRALTAATKAGGTAPRTQQGAPKAPLAELEGQGGLDLTITSAEREPADYLTVRGILKNDGAGTVVVPAELRGNELDVLRTGPSLGGATVVDFTHHKRYYVLRDTDGRPLTTTGLSSLKAGESVRVFMQFPAPPTSTSTVGFQLPLFDTANIKISG